MSRALLLAHQCEGSQDVPVGAVVVDPSGRIIGRGWNQREETKDPTAHAEILALREAGETLGSWNLAGCTLVVTLEPCTMCAGAVVASRVDRLVFGAWDPKGGAAGSVRDIVRDARLNHQVEVIPGVLGDQASIQLRGFFAEKRMEANKESDFWQRRTPSRSPVQSGERARTPDSLPTRRRSDRHAGKIEVPPLKSGD